MFLDENIFNDDINEGTLLDMIPKIEEKYLPPDLKEAEKRMEEEILDVLNESWDDSTILRRDSLLAELVFKLEKMVVRFLDNNDEIFEVYLYLI